MRIFTIIMGIFLTIGGFYVFTAPVNAFFSIIWIFGILLMITGINIIIDHFAMKKSGMKGYWDLVGGILTIILSLFILYGHFAQIALQGFIIFVFGAWVLISGIIRIFVSLQHKKNGERIWIWIMIMGILSVVLGVYGFVNPVVFKMAIGFMLGFFILMQGINMIGLGISLGRINKNNSNDNDNKSA